MLVLIRSNAIAGDPRVEKYLNYLDKESISYTNIGWNRTHDSEIAPKTIYYQKEAGYSMGGFKAIKNRIFWFFFCIRTLFALQNVKVIHGCDLDSAFPAVLYKLLGHWKVKIIFDVFDWYSATLANQPRYVRFAFQIMEYITVKFSKIIIICEEERIRQIPYKVDDKIKVLPNIPSFGDVSFLSKVSDPYFKNEKLTLTYVGGFYEGRFLDELLDVAEQGYFNLLIAGFADKKIEDRCNLLSKSKDNIIYFGKVPYSKGLNIMYNSDIIYAMYCKTNPNHIYAAPNKFYEGMLLSKPTISTKGTIVGEKIEKMGIGYTIEEDKEELIRLVQTISKTDISIKGQKAHEYWVKRYKDYVSSFMSTEYSEMIK